MKRAFVCAIALAFVALVETAAADPLTDAERKELVLTDEAGDAWLHDHCSFRGVGNPTIRNANVLGQVVELIDNGQAPLAKEFRCAERPPFWKGVWSPAPSATVDCTEPKPAGLCVPPLAPAVPKASAPATRAPVAIPAAPPEVAPPPPAPVAPAKVRAKKPQRKPASSPIARSAAKPGDRKLR